MNKGSQGTAELYDSTPPGLVSEKMCIRDRYTNALLNVGYVVIHYLKDDKIFFFEYFISFVYCII